MSDIGVMTGKTIGMSSLHALVIVLSAKALVFSVLTQEIHRYSPDRYLVAEWKCVSCL